MYVEIAEVSEVGTSYFGLYPGDILKLHRDSAGFLYVNGTRREAYLSDGGKVWLCGAVVAIVRRAK